MPHSNEIEREIWEGRSAAHRNLRHPDWFSLLVTDLVFKDIIPNVGARLQVNACWNTVRENTLRLISTATRHTENRRE
jgi:predicted acyltransferase